MPYLFVNIITQSIFIFSVNWYGKHYVTLPPFRRLLIFHFYIHGECRKYKIFFYILNFNDFREFLCLICFGGNLIKQLRLSFMCDFKIGLFRAKIFALGCENGSFGTIWNLNFNEQIKMQIWPFLKGFNWNSVHFHILDWFLY